MTWLIWLTFFKIKIWAWVFVIGTVFFFRINFADPFRNFFHLHLTFYLCHILIIFYCTVDLRLSLCILYNKQYFIFILGLVDMLTFRFWDFMFFWCLFVDHGLSWLKNTFCAIHVGQAILEYIYAWSERKCWSILILFRILACHFLYFISPLFVLFSLLNTPINSTLIQFIILIFVITVKIFYSVPKRLFALGPLNAVRPI